MLVLSKVISRPTLIGHKVLQTLSMHGRRINSYTNLSLLKGYISSQHRGSSRILACRTGSFKNYCSPVCYPSKQMNAENGGLLLPAVNDDHGGVIVDMEGPMEAQAFLDALRASMIKWKDEGKKGVWIKLPIELANLVEVAVKEGFWYHHAEPKYLMLVYWIPETVCTIPGNATHRVGVGALVLNEKRELLVVQENSGWFRGTGIWKIPTGVVDEGEDICVAAVREVKEETGELEIEDAQWMPVQEFAEQPFAQKSALFKRITELCLAKIDKNYSGFSPTPLSSEGKPPYIYLNTKELNQSVATATNQL